MSNPNKAVTVELRELIAQNKAMPRLETGKHLPGDWDERVTSAARLEAVCRQLKNTRGARAPTILKPKDLVAEPSDLMKVAAGKGKNLMHVAPKGRPVWQHRSGHADSLGDELWQMLHEDDRERIRTKVETTGFVTAGAEWSLGRVARHSPPRGYSPPKPPTDVEAGLALLMTGYDSTREARTCVPAALWDDLYDPDDHGAQYVKVNAHANNGCPVGRTLSDPLALEKVKAMVADFQAVFDHLTTPEDVFSAYKQLIIEKPWMVVATGATKNECIEISKVVDAGMRHYVIIPAAMKIYIQQATQAMKADWAKMEAYVDHYGDAPPDEHNTSFMGCTFTGNGAASLLRTLAWRTERHGHAFTTSGDDGLFMATVRGPRGEKYSLVAELDISKQDISTCAETKLPVIRAMARQLAKYHLPAAYLWQSFMKQRLETVATSVNTLTEDGGPSGTPFQSELNNTIFTVANLRLATLLKALGSNLNPTTFRAAVAEVGAELGYEIKVGGYYDGYVGVQQVLLDNIVTYCGYELEMLPDATARVCGDIGRFFSTLPWPRTRTADRRVFLAMEAVRVGSKVMALGCGHSSFNDEMMERAYTYAIDLLVRSMELTPTMEDKGKLEQALEIEEKFMLIQASRPYMIRQLLKGWYHSFPLGAERGQPMTLNHLPELKERVEKVLTADTTVSEVRAINILYGVVQPGPNDEAMTWQDVLRLSTIDVPLSQTLTEEAIRERNEGVIALAQAALSPAPAPTPPAGSLAARATAEEQIKGLLKLGPRAGPSGVEGFIPQRETDGDNVGRPPPLAGRPKKLPAPKKQGRGAAAPAGMHQAPQRQRGGAAALAAAYEEDEELARRTHQWNEMAADSEYGSDAGSDDQFGEPAEEVSHDTAVDHGFRFGGIQGSTG